MKRIISLLLIVTTLFTTFAVNVSAASQEEFISEVALIYEDSVEEAKAAIAGTDWKLYEQDLNPDADAFLDDGVYLIYKTSTNVEDAITDLRVMDMYGGYSTGNYEKQLEASREAYLKMVKYIRTAAAEFKTLFEAGDEMAKIAYRQMNYYRDADTKMLMGDFMLNIPSDEALVTVMMEGNMYVVTNLISLLAIGISGASGETLATRIDAMYQIKDTLTDIDYYDKANLFSAEFSELAAAVKRYNALSAEYDLTDEDMSEEEFEFLTQYVVIAGMLEQIPYGEETLKDFIVKDGWELKDLYPVVAALSEGQLALSEMGVFTTVLQYGASSKPIEKLYATLEEVEAEMTDADGNLKVFDVYAGVDRSIFDGNFAFTTAAERQQALTGKEWTYDYYYLSEEAQNNVPETAMLAMVASGLATLAAMPITIKITAMIGSKALLAGFPVETVRQYVSWKIYGFLTGGEASFTPISGAAKYFYAAGIGLLVAAIGVYGISYWHGYYNPDYTPIPNNMVDVKETDIGDKYIKYTAAKVFENGELSEKNADLNAYEGREWNALYYTKDATAGKCLTPKFVYSETSSTIARRHQGISMFGETEAFNLNSHVFNDDAPGVYVTIRYSTTKKAAADVPTVVGSMFATGALYALTALAGAGAGVGGTILLQNAKKKKKENELVPENSNEM